MILINWVQFFLFLIITIFLHELAHLIAAKLCKCKVEVFSIGFGKPILFSKKFKDTIYQFTPWIIGGYCKLKDELICSRSKYSFTNLPYYKKVIITLAGCAINIVTGLISVFLGALINNYDLMYFGILSALLGATNLIPFPALDGSYIVLVWLEKLYGKRKGYDLMNKLCQFGFKVLIILNILSVPLIIYLMFFKK